MVRCLDCANFHEDRFCEWCKKHIKRKSAEKSMRCDGFIRKKLSQRKLEKMLEVK